MVEQNEQPPSAPPADRKEPAAPVVLDARELLQGKNEIWIELAGVRYRLRVTRRNKLILQK